MPLHNDMREMVAKHAYGGVRIGSKVASMGTEASAAGLQRLWFLAKLQVQQQGHRHVIMGTQFDLSRLGARFARPAAFGQFSDVVSQLTSRASVFAEYTLGPPSGSTTIHVAVDEARLLKMAVFHHIARVRRVYNLFEDDDVVGVCNYLDFGIRVVAPLDQTAADESDFQVAASWQVCSCWLCSHCARARTCCKLSRYPNPMVCACHGFRVTACCESTSVQANSNLMVKAAACAKRVTTALILKSWWCAPLWNVNNELDVCACAHIVNRYPAVRVHCCLHKVCNRVKYWSRQTFCWTSMLSWIL
jgi:hypothetical protein